jgi:hypothetical protein
MATSTIVGIVIVAIILVYNFIFTAKKNTIGEEEIGVHSAVNFVGALILFLVMWGGTTLEQIAIENDFKQKTLDGNWEIRTRTNVILNDKGDTIKNDVVKYVHFLEKEND